MSISLKSKQIVSKILPYKLIKFVIKYLNINFALWGSTKKDIGSYLVRNCDTSFNDYNMEAALGQEVINEFKNRFENYKAHNGFLCEYILQCEDCIIEPEFGWGITKRNELIFDSISNNSWIETYHPSYFAYKKNKHAAIYYPEIISINLLKGGDNNYWHFLHDLLGQVALSKLHNIDAPILISKSLSEKAYFTMALQQSEQLAKTLWVVRDKQYIKAGKAYFLQTKPNDMKQFWGILDLLEIKDSNKRDARKIFLTRNKNRIRFISNTEQIEAIAKQNGFEIVDTDSLGFLEQINLFSKTTYLIGIHGAGLTNIIFRKNAPLTVLELFPKDYIEPHYFWLTMGLGNKYLCQVGSLSYTNTSFQIDTNEFQQKINEMLAL
jgi:hypothetical protein